MDIGKPFDCQLRRVQLGKNSLDLTAEYAKKSEALDITCNNESLSMMLCHLCAAKAIHNPQPSLNLCGSATRSTSDLYMHVQPEGLYKTAQQLCSPAGRQSET